MRAYLSLFIFSILSITSCKRDGKVETSATDYNTLQGYITEHSPERISVKDEVLFRFKPKYQDDSALAKSAKIVPSVAGDWSWSDGGLLTFKPNNHFDYDKKYEVVINVPNSSDIIRWQFVTMPLRYEFMTEGISIDPGGDVSLSGRVRTSDFLSKDKVESMLKITQSSGTPSIVWQHDQAGHNHSFVISDIRQEENKDEKISLSFNGKPYDDFTYDRSFTVFSKNSFQFVSAELDDAPEHRVRLQFSSPVAQNQNLKGLITIDKQSKSPKTLIDGNTIWVYPAASVDGAFKLYISDKLVSAQGKSLGKESLVDLRFDMAAPAIRSLSSGSIIPNAQKAIFAIESINLNAVDVEIVKIFNDNVLQHLQRNRLSEGYDLSQVGRIVWRGTVDIPNAGNHTNKWMRVGINLRDYLSKDPGAIYQVRVGYQQAYAYTDCTNDVEPVVTTLDDPSMMTYRGDFYYHYDERDDPCSPYFYNPDRFIKRNILLSDVGVITTQGRDDTYTFAVSDIPTGSPLSGATVTLYDYQQQPIIESTTSADGLLTTAADRKAAFAIISHASGYAYVRYQDNEANSLSEFDVAGSSKSTPIDGFIYTDRGVYRPGDTLFLHFMLEDVNNPLPDLHPVTLTIKDPKGAVQYERTTSQHIDKIYSWPVATSASSSTGIWRATVSVGQKTFYKTLRVEAIKPNRLKITLNHDNPMQYTSGSTVGLSADWLYGAPAAGLDAHVEATLVNTSTTYDGYSKYSFTDPAREGITGLQTWFKGKLDQSGDANIPMKINPDAFPGKVSANVKTRVFEPSGNFSVDYTTVKISPFDSYVGVSVPKNRWGYSSVEIGADTEYQVVVLDPDGRPVADRQLSVGFYDVKWEWWYYRSNNRNLYRLNSAEHKEAFYTTTVTTDSKGVATVTASLLDTEYGRKMIRICDQTSGHCSGQFFYATSYDAPVQEENRESLAQLTLASDKDSYEVGERAKIVIPSEEGTRLLISIEDGTQVIYQEWIDGQKEQTDYEIELNKEMAPNVYAYVTMVQAYDTKQNDLPIRMYGVLPITVNDPATRLNPEVKMPERIAPMETFTVEVSERARRSMSYTIAIVDEGLLDLTRFKTPDPHGHFYAHQALGVNTWDIYNDVLTGVNGEVDQMISVGGGAETAESGAKKATRFKPVVMTAGPFKLGKGKSAKHTFSMPNYMGAVRTMVVARDDDSYGHTATSTQVNSPVMVLSTLPRVLSPGEEISIPVSVFATDPSVKDVDVTIEGDDHFQLLGAATQTIHFDKIGDQLVHFRAKIKEGLGIGHIAVKATSGRHRASQEVEIDVRNPNPYTTSSEHKILAPGEEFSVSIESHGIPGSNDNFIELSSFPAVNLENRLDMLINYPYGCVEQTTSGAFAQIYLNDIMDLSKKQRDQTNRNVSAAIRRLNKMQLTNGGFSYWPGGRRASEWGTSYAGHFLTEAKKNGYAVRNEIISKWISYQTQQARSFKLSTQKKHKYYRRTALVNQAYRLYTLALNGSPEVSAMNVMKLERSLPNVARYLLAGAYATSGKKNAAIEILQGASASVDAYQELGGTYGSALRDKALIAQVLLLTDREHQATILMKEIAEALNSATWYSTQTVGQSLAVVGSYLSDMGNDASISSDIKVASEPLQSISSTKPIYSYTYDPDKYEGQTISVKNTGDSELYLRLTSRGQISTRSIPDAAAANKNISLAVRYTDMNGKDIDVTSLPRGTDFIAEFTIRNLRDRGPLLEELALTQVIPAGWEIQSGGLSNVSSAIKESAYDYRDVRDDRVSTFFDLRDQTVYRVMITAAYDGEFFLPPALCEAMYDQSVSANTAGQVVYVTEP